MNTIKMNAVIKICENENARYYAIEIFLRSEVSDKIIKRLQKFELVTDRLKS